MPSLNYGFDVQFLVEGPQLDVNAIREHIVAMGEYRLVEGDGNLVKVHVHVPDPGVVLSYAVSLGFVTDVVVENMDDMSIPDMPAGFDPRPATLPGRAGGRRTDAGHTARRGKRRGGRVSWLWRRARDWRRSSRAWAHKRSCRAAKP